MFGRIITEAEQMEIYFNDAWTKLTKENNALNKKNNALDVEIARLNTEIASMKAQLEWVSVEDMQLEMIDRSFFSEEVLLLQEWEDSTNHVVGYYDFVLKKWHMHCVSCCDEVELENVTRYKKLAQPKDK